MELTSFTEVRNTRAKLERLERIYEEQSLAPAENAFTRELSLKSIRAIIDQLRGEIARFEARACLPGAEGSPSIDAVPVRPTEAG